MKVVKIYTLTLPEVILDVKYCDTFVSKLIGLMFSRKLGVNNGIILVENNETRINTSIHMMFMNFDLTILWLDDNMVIVDKVLAKRWILFYFPKKPAQYVVELHLSKFTEYKIGDQFVMVSDI